MVCCGSLSIISCEGENPSHQHTATPKHRPLCASGLTCLRLFAKPKRQSWQDKDRKTVSALPRVATRGVLEGDFAGGHLTNRAAPRGPRKGVTRGRLLVARWGGISDDAVVLFAHSSCVVCDTHHRTQERLAFVVERPLREHKPRVGRVMGWKSQTSVVANAARGRHHLL